MSPEEYKSHRKRIGLTQAMLAIRLGLPRTAIVKRESGKQRIIKESVIAILSFRKTKPTSINLT